MKIYVDGGTVNNGRENQESCIAVWAKGGVVALDDIGDKTNNEAEYTALIEGCKWAKKENHPGSLQFYSDSKLVVNQVCYKWRIKATHLKSYLRKARRRLSKLKATLHWIPREKNKAGIYLEENYSI